jgi:DMSO reductase anchor subunit
MHPAFSVILFTVTSGMGYGILVFSALIALQSANPGGQLANTLLASTSIGLICVALGLISSTFHLANPKNAWRAFFRFRSSWLSREGVFAILSFPITILFIVSFYFVGFNNALLNSMAVILIAISLVTIYSSGMIYACLKTIRAWNSPLVPWNFILIGLLSGSLASLTIFNFFDKDLSIPIDVLLALATLILISKIIYYYFIGKPSGLSIKTATGLSARTVRLLHTGESSKNFSMREFGFDVSPAKVLILRYSSLIFMVIIPAYSLWSQELNFNALLAATLACFLGTILERWLFFAEAKHVVNLYYGREA